MVTSFIIHAPLQSLLLPPSESYWYVCVIYTARCEKSLQTRYSTERLGGTNCKVEGFLFVFFVFSVTCPTSTELGEGNQDLRRQDCSNICGSSPKLFVWLQHFLARGLFIQVVTKHVTELYNSNQNEGKKSIKFDKQTNLNQNICSHYWPVEKLQKWKHFY